jgi:hypothetical protein
LSFIEALECLAIFNIITIFVPLLFWIIAIGVVKPVYLFIILPALAAFGYAYYFTKKS